MNLLNIIYALIFDFNLIFLGQLRKSGILYYNHPDFIIFKKKGSTLRVANRYKIFFVFDTSSRVVLVEEKNRPTYFFSPNPPICH